MKIHLLQLLIFLNFVPCLAQSGFLKSILNKPDSTQVLLLDSLSRTLMTSKPTEAMSLARMAYGIAKNSQDKKGLARSLNRIATLQRIIGNYPKALQQHLEALKIAEEAHDIENQLRINLNIGNLFFEQEQFEKAGDYYYKAKSLLPVKNKDLEEGVYINLGSYFARKNILDSALIYTQKAYAFAKAQKSSSENTILLNLANINFRLKKYQTAKNYYFQSIEKSKEVNNRLALSDNYLELAELYLTTHQQDSALYNAQNALDLAKSQRNYQRIYNASLFLSKIFENKTTEKSYTYFKTAIVAKDSIMNQQKVQQLQNLVINEQFRQQEIEQEKKEQEENRAHNLQLFAISVFVFTFLIFVILLTRRHTNPRLLDNLATISLLLVFEFISLLIHPFLENITHHNPVLMLLGLVLISSILVPLHHKLTDFFKHKLIHKHTENQSIHPNK